MTTIILQRTIRKGKAVIGQIDIPLEQGDYTVRTLENADFLIPAGIYPLRRTWSPKFKKLLPLIDEVPDREGIRIIGVPGNFNFWGERRTRETYPYDEVVRQSEGFEREHEHSTGCVLTNPEGMDLINVLFNQLKKWYEEEEMLIDVRDDVDA